MQTNDGNKGPTMGGGGNRVALIIVSALVVVLLLAVFFPGRNSASTDIPYSGFLSLVEGRQIASAKIVDQTSIQGEIKTEDGKNRRYTTRIPYLDPDLIKNLQAGGVVVSSAKAVNIGAILLGVLPWLIFIFIFWRLFSGFQNANGANSAFSFGKSRAKKFDEGKKLYTFDDVAGQEEAKRELVEVVDFLKDPARFEAIGARIPKGILLVGSPGTGKTLLARSVAGEAKVPFFHISGSDFVEMFVGVGASRVRDLFNEGRKAAPCLIFIDEIDAVGRTRGAGMGGGHDEREQTLNQMLVEMDGFESKDGVIVIAATNRPDVLDPALLRPGRFDRQVVVDNPDIKEREAILRLHSKKIKPDGSVDLNVVARSTPGASGADLANIVNEAALLAARNGRKEVSGEDFEEALDKTLMGVARKSKVMTEPERQGTAYHEAGHTLLHYYLEHADPLHKVTIIMRGRALGLTFSLPEYDKYSHSANWLKDRIKIMFGGYAAEQIVFNATTTGAANDIKQATDLARRMVCEWGMSDKAGAVAWGEQDEPIFFGREITSKHSYSEETAAIVDGEVRKLLTDALNEARAILTEHHDQLETLTRALLERETMTDADIRELLHIPKKESSIS